MHIPMTQATYKWLSPPIFLAGDIATLEPFDIDHLEELLDLGSDERIWEFFPVNLADAQLHRHHLLNALHQRDEGEHYPFVVRVQATGRLAGYTRLFNLFPMHRKLEIGSWLHPDYWGTGINVESKYILLRHCFEVLDTVRVQFKASNTNVRSLRAIEKLGATFEGIVRNDRILPDGTCRHASCYSILAEEWPTVKTKLLGRMAPQAPTHEPVTLFCAAPLV
jgi:RimJ/RimL family protein N-acetyltransferase